MGLFGLLGQQIFTALDVDLTSTLRIDEFIGGLYRLYKGTEEEQFAILMDVVDFNRKGFVVEKDVKAVLDALPRRCDTCGQEMNSNLDTEDVVNTLFRDTVAFSYTALWDLRHENRSVFVSIRSTILHFLPSILCDIMGMENQPSCSSQPSHSLQAECMPTMSRLQYHNRSCFFTLYKECLCGYTNLTSDIPKVLIHIKELFVNPVNETEFELKNCSAVYQFTADSEETRDKWVEEIMTSKKYRWFDDFYEAGEVIGTGGQAKVLYGVSRGSRQPVAVKIVGKEGLDNKNELRIRREINILKTISHPNLLHLYDVFETTERIYIVTEYFPLQSLYSYLEPLHFKASEGVTKGIITDIATALLYLHSHGIVHRDIKPENIMLRANHTGDMQAILIDFGLACYLGPDQYANEAVGTLKYAAPEVLSHLPYNFKADCWSLGVILYIMLSGKMPFYGNTDHEVALKILKWPILVRGEQWEGVSSEALGVVTGLLNRKPVYRWGIKDVLNSTWLKQDGNTEDWEGKHQIPRLMQTQQNKIA